MILPLYPISQNLAPPSIRNRLKLSRCARPGDQRYNPIETVKAAGSAGVSGLLGAVVIPPRRTLSAWLRGRRIEVHRLPHLRIEMRATRRACLGPWYPRSPTARDRGHPPFVGNLHPETVATRRRDGSALCGRNQDDIRGPGKDAEGRRLVRLSKSSPSSHSPLAGEGLGELVDFLPAKARRRRDCPRPPRSA